MSTVIDGGQKKGSFKNLCGIADNFHLESGLKSEGTSEKSSPVRLKNDVCCK